MHVVVCVTGGTFVVVGPFDTATDAEAWKARKQSEPMSVELGTAFFVFLLVPPQGLRMRVLAAEGV